MLTHSRTRLATLCFFVSLFLEAQAQVPATQYQTANQAELAVTLPAKARKATGVAEQQSADAVYKVNALADEANGFKDQALRVRVQAHAADILWDTDVDRARFLFRRAWDIADTFDREGERAAEEARDRILTSRKGITFIPAAPNLRSEILGLAARRDQALCEGLLISMGEATQSKGAFSRSTDHDRRAFFDPTEPPPSIAKRLELATELLRQGDVERAKVFADPGLDRATSPGMIFLGTLRERDSDAADTRYSRLLELAPNDSFSDATTVSLLSSYVFARQYLVTGTRNGRLSNKWSDVAPTTEPSAALRARFLKVASIILLRPSLPPDQDRTSAGRAGVYFTIARLLPLFKQYALDQVPALNAQLAILDPDTPEVYKNNDNGLLTIGVDPDDVSKEDLSNLLLQVSSSTAADERDLVYAKAIRIGAMKGDERIREFADQIKDIDLRKSAQSFVDFSAIRGAVAKQNTEAAIRIVSAGNLPPIQRVWAYSEIARLLQHSDPSRSIQLLNQAAREAFRIKEGESDRVRALTCVATQFYTLDPVRMWEMTEDIVKSTNEITDFGGEDGNLTAQLRARNVVAVINFDSSALRLPGLFELLANDDYQRAFNVARRFKSDSVRVTTNLAIARSVLKKQRE